MRRPVVGGSPCGFRGSTPGRGSLPRVAASAGSPSGPGSNGMRRMMWLPVLLRLPALMARPGLAAPRGGVRRIALGAGG
ncbi:MAG: hypothetical protein PVF68_13810 [Acidobacteriota bacterium]|jgi:hypothetical protein